MEKSTTLVLLPGLDGTDVFFRPLVAALPAAIRPLVVCYPQAGGSYEDLLALVRRAVAGIPEFYVLGSSFSGPLAVMLAAAEPTRVRGIILSATFLSPPRRGLVRLRPAVTGPMIWALRAARRIPVWTLRRRADPFRLAKAETWSRVSARALAARLRAILKVDVRDLLPACAQPVLCVVFGADRVVPRHSSEEIMRCQPAARLVTLPGDHFGMYTDPERLADELRDFIGAAQAA